MYRGTDGRTDKCSNQHIDKSNIYSRCSFEVEAVKQFSSEKSKTKKNSLNLCLAASNARSSRLVVVMVVPCNYCIGMWQENINIDWHNQKSLFPIQSMVVVVMALLGLHAPLVSTDFHTRLVDGRLQYSSRIAGQ